VRRPLLVRWLLAIQRPPAVPDGPLVAQLQPAVPELAVPELALPEPVVPELAVPEPVVP
jgi:hypothetical protein